MAILPKTSVFTAFFVKGCLTFLEQDTRSQAFVPLATMPKTLVFTALLLLYTTYSGRRHAVTSTHAFGEDATTLVFAACLPLCTHLCLFVQHKRKNAVRSFSAAKTAFEKQALFWVPRARLDNIAVRSVFALKSTEPMVPVVILTIVKMRPANATRKKPRVFRAFWRPTATRHPQNARGRNQRRLGFRVAKFRV